MPKVEFNMNTNKNTNGKIDYSIYNGILEFLFGFRKTQAVIEKAFYHNYIMNFLLAEYVNLISYKKTDEGKLDTNTVVIYGPMNIIDEINSWKDSPDFALLESYHTPFSESSFKSTNVSIQTI